MIWKLKCYFHNMMHLSLFFRNSSKWKIKKKMVDKWHKEIGWSFCTPLSLYSLCMQSSISHTHFGNACVWFSHSSWSRWRIFLASLQKWSLGFSFECCCHKEAIINLRSCLLHLYISYSGYLDYLKLSGGNQIVKVWKF